MLAHAALVWLVSPAYAQSTTDAERAQALIDEGVALRRTGDDEGALVRFQQSLDLVRTARARAQIALVEQALGRWIDAEAHLREALGSHEAWIEERRPTLAAQLEVIHSHLGRVQLVGGVRGATVTLDRVPVGSLPIGSALWVEPGRIVVEVRAEGYLPFSRTVTAAEGELVTTEVELIASARSAVAAPVAAADRAPTGGAFPLGVVGWSAIGVGAAAFVLGGVSLAVRNGEAETFNSDACVAGGLTRGENCRGHYDAALSWESASIATFVIGGALIAGGLVLVLLDATSSRTESSVSLACSPSVGATFGLTCGGTL